MEDQNTGAPRISRYETGVHAPDPRTTEQLAQILDLPVAYFYSVSDVLAEVILLVSRLPMERQVDVLDGIKAYVHGDDLIIPAHLDSDAPKTRME